MFRPDGDSFARARTRDALGERFRRRHLDEVLTWLKAAEPLDTRPNPDLLNLSNGLLHWRSGELLGHSPDQAGIVRIPHRWNPEAACDKVDAFLMETMPGDAIEFMYELLGYGLLPALPYHVAVLLLGSGGNGKSTWLRIARALYGYENTATRSLHELNEKTFARVDLFGRLANICGDLDARTLERSDTFKQITGGDAISGERKYSHAFDFTSYAKLIFSANQMPPTADQTLAYFDRWLIVPMGQRIRGTDREVPGLAHALTSDRGEMEGLLQAAVAGLRRLMARGHFEVPPTVRRAGETVREEIDTVRAFCAEEMEAVMGTSITRKEIYEAYGAWCFSNGKRALSMPQFRPKVLETFPTARESATDGTRVFKGIDRPVRRV